MISVLVADDHAVVRRGIRAFLQTEAGFSIAGEASTADEAVLCAERSRPHVALVDLVLPGEGIHAVRGIKRVSQATQVVVLTALEDSSRVLEVMQAGALSYLLKCSSPEELVAALRRAAAGEATLHPVAATRLVQRFRTPESPVEAERLTPREAEVLRLLAHGRSNVEIAGDLRIGKRTVKTHVSGILSKLGLADRTGAAVLAWRRGWVRAEEDSAHGVENA